GDGKGFPDHVGQIGGPADQVVTLGDGHGDAGDVHLLEGVLANETLAHVDGDKDNGGGVHIGGGDAGGQVGGAGAGSGKAYAHLAGRAGVAVGGMGGALLMGRQDVTDLVLVPVELQLVVNIQNGAARVTEYGIHTLFQQTFH